MDLPEESVSTDCVPVDPLDGSSSVVGGAPPNLLKGSPSSEMGATVDLHDWIQSVQCAPNDLLKTSPSDPVGLSDVGHRTETYSGDSVTETSESEGKEGWENNQRSLEELEVKPHIEGMEHKQTNSQHMVSVNHTQGCSEEVDYTENMDANPSQGIESKELVQEDYQDISVETSESREDSEKQEKVQEEPQNIEGIEYIEADSQDMESTKNTQACSQDMEYTENIQTILQDTETTELIQDDSQEVDIYLKDGFLCPQCGLFFSNTASLLKHVEMCRERQGNTQENPQDIEGAGQIQEDPQQVGSNNGVLCPECGLILPNISLLCKHVEIEHNDIEKGKTMDPQNSHQQDKSLKGTEDLLCPLCGLFYASKTSLWKHMRYSHKDFHDNQTIGRTRRSVLCTLCGQMYSAIDKLWVHMENTHKDHHNYETIGNKMGVCCHLCRQLYSNRDSLRVHIRKERKGCHMNQTLGVSGGGEGNGHIEQEVHQGMASQDVAQIVNMDGPSFNFTDHIE